MNLEEICLRNLDTWLTMSVEYYQFCEHDVDYIVKLNKAVAHKLIELLDNRVQGVSFPSFLYEINGEPEAALIESHKLRTVGSESHHVADIALQLAQPCIDDSNLTLFVHTIAMPGGWQNHKINRYEWRTRRAYKSGTLVRVELPDRSTVKLLNPPKPPGFGLTYDQIAEGTIYQEDE